MSNLNIIRNALHADKSVATSMKYLYAFLYLYLWTDSCRMKVHDGVFHVGHEHLPSVR